MRSLTVVLVVTSSALLSWRASGARDEPQRIPCTSAQLRALLAAHPGLPLIPELNHADLATLSNREPGKSILDWARHAPDTWPRTSYTLYRMFKKTGERRPYEQQYYEKRELLTRAALTTWLDRDDDALNRVNDYLWSVCEETTWVFPAHERKESYYIDLFCAETGSDIAHILYVLGSRLPSEVRDRARAELEKRILAPYAEHSDWYSWKDGRNNWTGVCAGSIGETFLLADSDGNRQAEALSRVLAQLDAFIKHGFEADGGCLEGVNYWNYGLLHYTTFAEMLRARTGGAIDLLSQPKLQAIARYPQAVALGNGQYASFADSHEAGALNPFETQRIAERTGFTALSALGQAAPTSWRFVCCLRNVLWAGAQAPAPELTDVYLPESAIAKRVGTVSGKPLILIAKAGHNAEPHNHNDVGSFIVHVGDTTYLCDPGAGLYSKEYFSSDRYKNIFCNSYGHSVPRIGGALQQPGAEHRGQMNMTPDKAIHITFDKAYDAPELKSADRTLSLRPDGTVDFSDRFTFNGFGAEVEEAFLTWLPVEANGAVAHVTGKEGVLELRATGAEFKVESLREACEANHLKETLSRITLTYPPKPESACAVNFVFNPTKWPLRVHDTPVFRKSKPIVALSCGRCFLFAIRNPPRRMKNLLHPSR